MVVCAVYGCSSRSKSLGRVPKNPNVRFFCFPMEGKVFPDHKNALIKERMRQWLYAIKRADLSEKNINMHKKVCSRHFIGGKPASLEDTLNVDWIPTQNMGTGRKELDLDRQDRQQRRAELMRDFANTKEATSTDLSRPSLPKDTINVVWLPTQAIPNHNLMLDDCQRRAKITVNVPKDIQPANNNMNRSQTALENDTFNMVCLPSQDIPAGQKKPNPVQNDKQPRLCVCAATGEVTVETPEVEPPTITSTDLGKPAVNKNTFNLVWLSAQTTAPVPCEHMRNKRKNTVCTNTKKKAIDMQDEEMPVIATMAISVACQTEISGNFISALTADNTRLTEELAQTKAALQEICLSRDSFKNDPVKVRHYTGFPDYMQLESLYDFLNSHGPQSRQSKLDNFQEVILFLMKLKLNVTFDDLAMRFSIAHTTAHRIFYRWLDVAYKNLKSLIRWPDREALFANTPESFKKKFGPSVVVMLDCFEVFTQKPSSVESRVATYSEYKQQNTLKFLVGMTPQGSISFLSKGFGGCSNDKSMAEECGVLDNLVSGDVVLAGRGFTIAEALHQRSATLQIPAFNTIRSPLRTKFKILTGILPQHFAQCRNHDDICTFDKVATVCAALCNLFETTALKK